MLPRKEVTLSQSWSRLAREAKMTVFLERVVMSMELGREGGWWVRSTDTTSLRGRTTHTRPEIWEGGREGRGGGKEGGEGRREGGREEGRKGGGREEGGGRGEGRQRGRERSREGGEGGEGGREGGRERGREGEREGGVI